MEIKKTKNKPRRVSAQKPILVENDNPEIESLTTQTQEKFEEELIYPNINDSEGVFTKNESKEDLYLQVPGHDRSFDIRNLSKKNRKLVFFYIPWTLLIVFILSSFYLWFRLSEIKKDPLKAAQAETIEIVGTVGKIMLLPTGEIPKIATLTIEDINKVKTQPFFINAKVGDKVLVYSVSRKVILYNPQTNKIIEVVNLNSDNSSGASPSL